MSELIEIEPGVAINPAHVVAVIQSARMTRVRLDYGPDHTLDGDRYRELVDKINGKKIGPSEVSDLLYVAWTIIANAGEGDWDREHPEWQKAAVQWRDRFHEWLDRNVHPGPVEESVAG